MDESLFEKYKLPDGRELSCSSESEEGRLMFEVGLLKMDLIYRDVCNTGVIPKLTFDPSWKVQIIPPFGGAVARFLVEKGRASVSVYIDFFNRLGFSTTAYWEVYPHNDYNTFRCDVKDGEALMKAIGESLDEQNRAIAEREKDAHEGVHQ